MFKVRLLFISLFFFVALPVVAEDVRDPTSPLGRQGATLATEAKPLVLNSVLISSQRKIAVINGKMLREGQVLPGTDGIKLQKILAQAVVLQDGNKTWTLTLSPGVVKKY